MARRCVETHSAWSSSRSAPRNSKAWSGRSSCSAPGSSSEEISRLARLCACEPLTLAPHPNRGENADHGLDTPDHDVRDVERVPATLDEQADEMPQRLEDERERDRKGGHPASSPSPEIAE